VDVTAPGAVLATYCCRVWAWHLPRPALLLNLKSRPLLAVLVGALMKERSST